MDCGFPVKIVHKHPRLGPNVVPVLPCEDRILWMNALWIFKIDQKPLGGMGSLFYDKTILVYTSYCGHCGLIMMKMIYDVDRNLLIIHQYGQYYNISNLIISLLINDD